MLDWSAAFAALAAIALLALSGWAWSVLRRDVSIVDSLWPLFFLLGALVYVVAAGAHGSRAVLLLGLVALWAARLSLYLAWRSRGEPEDRRYRVIRARNEPGFAWKSVYLVFGLQALLAWIIAMPLFAGSAGTASLGALDAIGVALWLAGIAFESIGDAQLASFKLDPANRGRVLDTGLWRYTRHPNYFGEALLWWGFFAIAAAGGGAWTVFAPLLMTILLLKVSGVALLEKDIGERRPGYRAYVARTSAFLPWRPRGVA